MKSYSHRIIRFSHILIISFTVLFVSGCTRSIVQKMESFDRAVANAIAPERVLPKVFGSAVYRDPSLLFFPSKVAMLNELNRNKRNWQTGYLYKHPEVDEPDKIVLGPYSPLKGKPPLKEFNVGNPSPISKEEVQINPGNQTVMTKDEIIKLVNRLAPEYGLPPKLVNAVIEQESGFDPNAYSSNGAEGLMQLMPSTSRAYGIKDPYDPEQNIRGGMIYLKQMFKAFHDDLELALAAYNAGPDNVRKYGGIPPYTGTQIYVMRVVERYQG